MSDTADTRPYRSFPDDKRPMPVGVMGLYVFNGTNYVPINTVNQAALMRSPHLFLVVQFNPTAQGLTCPVINENIDIKAIFDAFQQPVLNPQLIDGSRTIEECTDYPGSTSLWMTFIRPPSGAHVSNEIILAPSPMELGEHFVDIVLTDKTTGAQSKQRFEYIVVATGGQQPTQ